MSTPPSFINWAAVPPRDLAPGVTLRIVSSETIMLSLVELLPEAKVPLHQHPHEQMGIWLEGEGRFTVGEEERIVGPGDSYAIPGNVPHAVIAGPRGGKALDIFHPPREDYLR